MTSSLQRLLRYAGLTALMVAGACVSPGLSPDPRAAMHGIGSARRVDGGYWVFFSSSGLPPRGPDFTGRWRHDIYVAEWQPGQPALSPARVFLQRPEAQEPVSVAQSASGRILLTFEDGWTHRGSVTQHFALYGPDLKAIAPYPQEVEPGGHSGHAAAVGEHFVVFYSDGWITGGGVDDLGTGNGVYAKVYDGRGRLVQAVNVAHAEREWWPLVAGGRERALLLWQQYVPGETHARLRFAALEPLSGALSEPVTVDEPLRYYTYGLGYVAELARFVLAGAREDGTGFARLVDESGRVAASLDCMPPPVREAAPLVLGRRAYWPVADGGLLVLDLSARGIHPVGRIKLPAPWFEIGSLGLPGPGATARWLSLSPSGLEDLAVDLTRLEPLGACPPAGG